MTGLTYKTDARKVHQLIHRFVQDKNFETWINPKEKRQDGPLYYSALISRYGGKGNKAVRIKEEEALQTPLIYKNEKAMFFKKFLRNMQTMFTGFYDNG